MFNRCSYPGCHASARSKKETCQIHGRYVACGSHLGKRMFDRVLDSPIWLGCPLCIAAAIAAEQNEHHAAEAETARRNGGDRPQLTFSQTVAKFRTQGYGQEAAKALAKKDVSREQAERQSCTVAEILKERLDEERRRRLEAGSLTRCQKCGRFAPVSQNVVLEHKYEINHEGDWIESLHCPGTGEFVT